MDFNQLLQIALFGLLVIVFAKKIPGFGIRRPVAFLMLIAFVVLGGLVALKKLPLEMMPNISYGNVTIYVDVRGGMPPPDVERLVTKPIEEAMATVSKLKNIISTSKNHRSVVTLEFEPGTNMNMATLEAREKFLRVKHQLPKEIEKPVIAHYEEADTPVLIAALTSPHETPETLRQLVEETLKDKLLRVPGVANVEIGGGRSRKILVDLDSAKLVANGLPFQKIVSVLEQNNLNVRVGDVSGQQHALGLRTQGNFNSVEEIKKIGVAVTPAGGIIRLADLGTVKDDYLEAETFSRLNSKSAVTLYIQKESLANTVDVVQACEKVLGQFKQHISSDVELVTVSNQAKLIKQALYSVMMTLFYGMTLVILVLSLFLSKSRFTKKIAAICLSVLLGLLLVLTINGWPLDKTIVVVIAMMVLLFATAFWRRDLWPAFIVASTIPVSLLLTLGLMYFNHVSLNVISLSGLILGVGMLVDNAVVVLENVEQMLKKSYDRSRQEILDLASREMIQPMIGGTLTTIVVFLPFSLLQKQTQLLYAGIAFTVTTILLASLFTAIGLVPALLNRLAPEPAEPAEVEHVKAKRLKQFIKNFVFRHLLLMGGASFVILGALFWLIMGLRWQASVFSALALAVITTGSLMLWHFPLALAGLLRHRFKVIAAMLGLVVIGAMVFLFIVPKDFLASQEQNEFVVFVEMASGVRLDIANRIVKTIEERIQKTSQVKDQIKSISSKVEGWSSKIYVTLKPRAERTLSAAEVIAKLRKELVHIGEDYETFIYFSEPQSGKEIFVEVFGYNYETLADLAMQIANKMSRLSGLSDTKVRYRPGRPELKVKLNRNQVALLGLTNQQTAETLHGELRGLRATKFYDKQEEVETIVRLEPKQCETLPQLKQLMLLSDRKEHIPLEGLAHFEFGLSPSEIWHRNKTRMIQVSANLGKRSLGDAAQEIKAALVTIHFPEDYYADIGGDFEQMQAADKSFKLALIMTVALVFMVMAAVFESLLQPFIIMISVLLSTIGAVAALTMTGTTVTLGVSIGLLMLGGMVVNNGIMLIDRINQLKLNHPHIKLEKLIIWSSRQRLVPIAITTITTICGLIPMALDRSESAGLWQPLAITVIGGLTSGSILTLFVVPCFYSALEKIKNAMRQGAM